jgi:hypothetical protein
VVLVVVLLVVLESVALDEVAVLLLLDEAVSGAFVAVPRCIRNPPWIALIAISR